MKKRIFAVLLAVIIAMSVLSVNVAAKEYFTYVDELAGIRFDSLEKLSALIKAYDGKDAIDGVDDDISEYLLSLDRVYLNQFFANMMSKVTDIIVTPTYIDIVFEQYGDRLELYYYHSTSAGEREYINNLQTAERAVHGDSTEEWALQWPEINGSSVCYYEADYFDGKETYYSWVQDEGYFVLRNNAPFFEDCLDSLFCHAIAYPLGERAGWRELDGNRYYIELGGNMVMKSQEIGGIRYKFTADGVCHGEYTGWTRSSKGRRYYKNGVMIANKWLTAKNGTRYLTGPDGYLRTGWVARGLNKLYFFNEKGEWDGERYYTGYAPKTLDDFLKDFDYSDELYYEYNIGFSGEYKAFESIRTVSDILETEKDRELLFDNIIWESDCESVVELAPIYHGNDDIVIRCWDSEDRSGGVKNPHLVFSKDENGDSYFYCSYYGFGCKLENSGAYDRLAKLIGK